MKASVCMITYWVKDCSNPTSVQRNDRMQIEGYKNMRNIKGNESDFNENYGDNHGNVFS